MELLVAVNNIIPYLGENPVTSVEVNHPTVGLIIQKLDQVRMSVLTDGYWFNTADVTLYADPEGYVSVPRTTLSIMAPGLEVRNMRLYNIKARTYVFSGPVPVQLVEDLPWEELPSVVQELLVWQAATLCYLQDFGVEKTMMELKEATYRAQIKVDRDHLRNSQFNSIKNRRAARVFAGSRGGFNDDLRR